MLPLYSNYKPPRLGHDGSVIESGKIPIRRSILTASSDDGGGKTMQDARLSGQALTDPFAITISIESLVRGSYLAAVLSPNTSGPNHIATPAAETKEIRVLR